MLRHALKEYIKNLKKDTGQIFTITHIHVIITMDNLNSCYILTIFFYSD